ncbi:MAG TPA: S26 family signal peptidase [Pirellulaceae bacterium]|jgi:type IV secretory pathway protease TraF|nr:S26 family signal peptidase [Pirellulaceae bacterium]
MTLPLILLGAGTLACVFAGFSLWRRTRQAAEPRLPVAIIVGSSLAETLHGPTVVGTCDACGHPLRFAFESLPRTGDVLCPNCGEPVDPDRLESRQADRVAVRPLSQGDLPELGRLYVFAAPEGKDAAPIVKRVVAGPGSRVSISQGDLYLDGEILRKDPRDETLPRIVVHQGKRLWSKKSDAKGHVSTFRPLTLWNAQPRPTPVLDAYPSQATERRRLNFVPDVWASGQLRSDRPVAAEFIYRAGERTFSLAISAGGAWKLHDRLADRPLGEGTLSDWSSEGPFRFGMLDRQIFLVRANRKSIVVPLQDPAPFAPSESPLAIAVPRKTKVTGLRVERDIHYLPPVPGEDPWTEFQGAASAGWFALGDYPAYSTDSRHFGRLPGDSLLGEALLPPIDVGGSE